MLLDPHVACAAPRMYKGQGAPWSSVQILASHVLRCSGLHMTPSVVQPRLQLWHRVSADRHRRTPARYALCTLHQCNFVMPLKGFPSKGVWITISQVTFVMPRVVSTSHACSRPRQRCTSCRVVEEACCCFWMMSKSMQCACVQGEAYFSPASRTDKAVRRLNMTAVCTSESVGQ